MNKIEFYKEQLAKDSDVFSIEITEVATNKDGVANMTMDGKSVSCFYGAEDGSDDCIIPFEEFMTRFTIDRVVDESNNIAYKVVAKNDEYQLEKE